MKKIFCSLVLFSCLFLFNERVLADNRACHYKQKELGIEFDIDLSAKDPSDYKITSHSCDGEIATCYTITDSNAIAFKPNEGVNITIGENIFAQGELGITEYYFNIYSDDFYDYTYNGTCPDLNLTLYGSRVLIGVSGDIGLENVDASPVEQTCPSATLAFDDDANNVHFSGTIEFYKQNNDYYFSLTTALGSKNSAVFASNNSTPTSYITYKTNDVLYSILIMEESKTVFKDMIDSGNCIAKDQIFVYKNSHSANGFYISHKKIDEPNMEKVESYNVGALLGSVKNPLGAINKNILQMPISLGGVTTTLSKIEANDDVCTLEESNGKNKYYCAEQSIKRVLAHCNEVMKNVHDMKDTKNFKVKDCLNFRNFYDQLVAKEYLEDFSLRCNILSIDMQKKLNWVLNLLKIVGPILALGLGTLDFIKTVTAGDADKEMKSAFKRLVTRIIAAILLFILPIILAFLMDTFLGNEDGYDSDDPFCNIVDWEKLQG